MGEENVYFDDEEYLVTSCRFLIREEGKTMLIKDLSDPLLVETGIDSHKSYPLFDTLGPLGLLVDVVVNELKADSRNKWGEFRVVATLKGKKETLVAEKFFPRDAFANPESECWRQSAIFGSPAWYQLRKKLLDLSIALGAAIAGA